MNFLNIALITAVLAGAAMLAAIRAAGAFRFHALTRAYGASSLALALVAAGLGAARHEPRLYLIAGVSILLKAVVIPLVLTRAAERAGMNMRLPAFIRPATTYMIVMVLVALVAFAASRSPFAAGADPEYLLIVGVAMVAVGLSMTIMRRDLLSQVMGFLVMENGVAAFSYAVIRDLPFLVELGILMTLTVGVVLMGTLSGRVRGLYGNESTETLRELTD